MNKYILLITGLVFSFSAFAQTPQEYEIIMNGKKEKVTLGKPYKFVTPKGDTIVYLLNDVPKNVVRDQPKVNENNGVTATNYKEPAAPATPEVKKTEGLSEVERLKEEARQKAKGNTGAAATPAATPTGPEKAAADAKAAAEAKKAADAKAAEEAKKAAADKKAADKAAADAKIAEAKKAAEEKALEAKRVAAEKEAKAVADKKAKAAAAASKTAAPGTVETEEKKAVEIVKGQYDFRKYYVADQNVNATNIAAKDTLKFITTDLSVYKDFPSLQFGSGSSLSLCYDYLVKAYHGYDPELTEKYTSRYKVCQVGSWSESKKTADVYVDTKTGKKKLSYSIAQLDEKNLVLVKR